MNDPWCQCGYRRSAHSGDAESRPHAGGHVNIEGKTVYKPGTNPGVTFVKSHSFNQGEQ